MTGLKWNANLLPTLKSEGIELDQRMLDAIQMAHGYDDFKLGTGCLFAALQILNTRGFTDFPDISKSYTVIPTQRDLNTIQPHDLFKKLLDDNADELRKQKQFGATQYLRFIIEYAIKNPLDSERPIAIQKIAQHYLGSPTADLDKSTDLQRLLGYIRGLQDGINDYQYIITFGEKGIIFRIVSDLLEGTISNSTGNLIPHKALMTHFGDIGFFTSDSIGELEELINSPRAKEYEFQNFFERYPHFLRIGDYREVYPHVYLTRESNGPLIPDFILTNKETQRSTIVKLKPANLKKRIITHQDNRIRFASAIMEARSQLQEYQDWFDQPAHRQRIKNQLGMEVYRPRLMIIIGRASEFSDGIERAKLDNRNPDIDLMTYDDILYFAHKRRIIVERNVFNNR